MISTYLTDTVLGRGGRPADETGGSTPGILDAAVGREGAGTVALSTLVTVTTAVDSPEVCVKTVVMVTGGGAGSDGETALGGTGVETDG